MSENALVWYLYRTNDGELFDFQFPFGEAMDSVKLDDERIAYRVYSSSVSIPEHMRAVQKGK